MSIPLFLPLTVGVVAGDTIAGEAGLGTLRYLLVAPAGRVWLLVVKYLGAAAFCLAATLTVVTAGVLAGLALFPVGPLTLLSGDTIGLGESFLRALLIAGYVTVSLLGLSAIGLFFSTLTVVPVGAMAATIVLSVVAQVLDSLPQLDWLHPWLFSHYWLDFADLLRQPMDFCLVRRERPAAGRLPAGLRGARLRPVRHQGHPELTLTRARQTSPRGYADCYEVDMSMADTGPVRRISGIRRAYGSNVPSNGGL